MKNKVLLDFYKELLPILEKYKADFSLGTPYGYDGHTSLDVGVSPVGSWDYFTEKVPDYTPVGVSFVMKRIKELENE